MTTLIRRTRRIAAELENSSRLTQLCSCGGCAAKLGQSWLAELLHKYSELDGNAMRGPAPRNVLVGTDTFDDAGVYQLRSDLALVQTVDFFTPIVDEPYDYGQIAAANALSDVYAMGGRPVTALNVLGIPPDKVAPEIVCQILSGAAAKAAQAKCAVIGGHTIRIPEPVYGMSVTGVVHPRRILTNARARPDDLLILTKPLGTGIATTAIKRGLASNELKTVVVASMKKLNAVGADLAERGLIKAATDVTGFGLTGHLANVLRASEVMAEIFATEVPNFGREILKLIDGDCIPGGTRSNLEDAEKIVDWGKTHSAVRILLSDAQTSGGLLLCVPPKNWPEVRSILKSKRTVCAAVIGRIGQGRPEIRVQ